MNQFNPPVVYSHALFLSTIRVIVFSVLVTFDVVTSLPRVIYNLVRKKLTEALHLLHDETNRNNERKLQMQIEELTQNVVQLKAELEKKEALVATLSLKFMQKNELTCTIRAKLESVMNRKDREDNSELLCIQKMLRNEENREEDWGKIDIYMEQIHGGLIQRLKSRFPKINAVDIKLCIYLRMNLSTKEIARLSNMTTRGIEASRYRLRKKLNIDSDINLTDFILGI